MAGQKALYFSPALHSVVRIQGIYKVLSETTFIPGVAQLTASSTGLTQHLPNQTR